jgi:hypothetical protein
MHGILQPVLPLSGAAFVILAFAGNEILGKAGEAPAAGASAGETARFLLTRQPTTAPAPCPTTSWRPSAI